AQLQVTGDGADLDEGLAFPGPPEAVVVGEGAGQRAGQGAALPLGAQAEIDAVGLAVGGGGGEQADQLAGNVGEVFIAGDAGDPLSPGLPLLGVDEHQVDVTGVVQLLAAELAEGQHDAADRPAVGGERLAEAPADRAARTGQGYVEGDV